MKEGQTIPISEVKGYYSIEEAAMAAGLSIKEVYDKLGIPESVSKGTKLKEISKTVPDYDFDVAKTKAGGTQASVKEPETSKTENDSDKVDISGIKGSMTIREAAQSLNMELSNDCCFFEQKRY